MTYERFHAQISRIARIAEGVFPHCQVSHSTDNMPKSFSLEIVNDSGERLALFPSTEVSVYENSSDEHLKCTVQENVTLWRHLAAETREA